MRRPPNTLVLAGILLALIESFVGPCHAQDTFKKNIDTNLLSSTRINIDCDFSTYLGAQDCVQRILPTVQYRAYHYIGSLTTFLLRVTYKEFPDPSDAAKPIVSQGSAFLVDRERGYFLTAKHVLLGPKVWSTFFPANHTFADLETAIEDYLYSEKVDITLQADEDAVPIHASLVALDRTSDLALIVVRNANNIHLSQYAALYWALPMATEGACAGWTKVMAIGFTQSPDSRKLERVVGEYGIASCDLFPQTYFIGGQKYRVPLLRTKSRFEPGFSGGPVLDGQLHVVGVVSGATPAAAGAGNAFFVPLPQITSFLARFR